MIDSLRMARLSVDILEEEVERARALREAGLELAPFGPRDETRDDVERDQPLGGVLVAVDAEGDADAPEHVFGLGAARGEQFGRRFFEPASDLAIERPRLAGGNAHLVERRHAACPNLIAWRRQARTTLRLGESIVATSMPSPRARWSASAPLIATSAGHAPKSASNVQRFGEPEPERHRAESRSRRGSPSARSRIARRAIGSRRSEGARTDARAQPSRRRGRDETCFRRRRRRAGSPRKGRRPASSPS